MRQRQESIISTPSPSPRAPPRKLNRFLTMTEISLDDKCCHLAWHAWKNNTHASLYEMLSLYAASRSWQRFESFNISALKYCGVCNSTLSSQFIISARVLITNYISMFKFASNVCAYQKVGTEFIILNFNCAMNLPKFAKPIKLVNCEIDQAMHNNLNLNRNWKPQLFTKLIKLAVHHNLNANQSSKQPLGPSLEPWALAFKILLEPRPSSSDPKLACPLRDRAHIT